MCKRESDFEKSGRTGRFKKFMKNLRKHLDSTQSLDSSIPCESF